MGKFLDIEALLTHLPAFVWIYIAVIIAIIIDLGTALHYCKRAGIPIVSYRLRSTVDKFIRYFGLLFIASTIDVICILVELYSIVTLTNLPLITGLAGICLCIIEAKSVYEHRDPERRKLIKKTAESLLETISRRDARKILDYITEHKEAQEDKEDKDNE